MKKLLYILFLSFICLSLYTFYILFFIKNNLNLAVVFVIFSVISFIVFRKNRTRISSPIFILTFMFYTSFVLPVYFLAIGYKGVFLGSQSEIFLKIDLITEALWISLAGLLGILIGSKITPNRRQRVLSLLSNYIHIMPLKNRHYIYVLIWFILSGLVRYVFRLGVAGESPQIPFAGYLQYFLYDGNIVLYSFIAVKSFKQSPAHFIRAILLGLVLVITQALLGWKGTIFSFFIITTLIALLTSTRTKIPKQLIFVLIMVAPLMMQLGNSVRPIATEGARNLNSNYEFFENSIMRRQGLTRLAYVAYYNGESYSIFNNFFFIDLFKNQISAVKYIDQEYHNIGKEQIHSMGGSGPGCAYLSWGIFGVFITYLFLFIFLHKIYCTLKVAKNKELLIVVFANLISFCFYLVSENVGLDSLVKIAVVIVLSCFWGFYLTPAKSYKSMNYQAH